MVKAIKTADALCKLKQPDTSKSLLDVIAKRFSPRVFSGTLIPKGDIESILEAGRWAPSAYNAQPWYFYWAQKGSSAYTTIQSALFDNNTWAKSAPVYIVACYIEYTEKDQYRFAQYDLGASVMSMVYQAQALGYHARQMGLYDKEKLLKTLPIDTGHIPFVIVAVGKIGDYTVADEAVLARDFVPRERKNDCCRRMP